MYLTECFFYSLLIAFIVYVELFCYRLLWTILSKRKENHDGGEFALSRVYIYI